MNKFKMGDVVKLRSGGPAMTVAGTADKDGAVYCSWFAGDKDMGQFFNVGILMLVPARFLSEEQTEAMAGSNTD